MINERQRDRAHRFLEDRSPRAQRWSRAAATTACSTGRPWSPTYADMPLWQQEIFAPIAPVMAVDSEDEAIGRQRRRTGSSTRCSPATRSAACASREAALGDGARQRLDLPRRGARAVRRPRIVRARRARGRRVEPRGVHGEAAGCRCSAPSRSTRTDGPRGPHRRRRAVRGGDRAAARPGGVPGHRARAGRLARLLEGERAPTPSSRSRPAATGAGTRTARRRRATTRSTSPTRTSRR